MPWLEAGSRRSNGSEASRRAGGGGPAWLLLVVCTLLAGCASSTAPGAVGVGRAQLLTVSPTQVDAQAVSGYRRLSRTASDAGWLNADAAVTGRVRGIAQRLIAEVGVFRSDARGWAWEVNVFDSPRINAFCAPGGKIGVFAGLVQRLEPSDDELAAVLGHEIAHALREHTREQMSQRSLSDSIVEFIAHSGLPYAAPVGMLASAGSTYLVRLPFTRQMETEADLIGLELMARAGYDPRLAAGVWRKMQAVDAMASEAEFLRTHPTHEERIEQIERATSRVMAVYAPGALLAPVREVAERAATAEPDRAGLSPSLAKVGPVAPVAPVGESEHQVRQAARSGGCAAPRVLLVARAPATERYAVSCEGGPDRRYVCEFGSCSQR